MNYTLLVSVHLNLIGVFLLHTNLCKYNYYFVYVFKVFDGQKWTVVGVWLVSGCTNKFGHMLSTTNAGFLYKYSYYTLILIIRHGI